MRRYKKPCIYPVSYVGLGSHGLRYHCGLEDDHFVRFGIGNTPQQAYENWKQHCASTPRLKTPTKSVSFSPYF